MRQDIPALAGMCGVLEMSDPGAIVKYMFDMWEPGCVPGSTIPVPSPVPVPLERLEEQICELAGHITEHTAA